MIHTNITHTTKVQATIDHANYTDNGRDERRIEFTEIFHRFLHIEMALKPYTIHDFRADVNVDLHNWRNPGRAQLDAELMIWTENGWHPLLALDTEYLDLLDVDDPASDAVNNAVIAEAAVKLLDQLTYRAQCHTAGRILPPGVVHYGAGAFKLEVTDEFADTKEATYAKATA